MNTSESMQTFLRSRHTKHLKIICINPGGKIYLGERSYCHPHRILIWHKNSENVRLSNKYR